MLAKVTTVGIDNATSSPPVFRNVDILTVLDILNCSEAQRHPFRPHKVVSHLWHGSSLLRTKGQVSIDFLR